MLYLVPPVGIFRDECHVRLQTGCPSCHPTSSVKALKETQSTDPNQWPGLVLSSSTTEFLKEGELNELQLSQ